MRDYVIRRIRQADISEETDGENYLARTVYEEHDLIDIGPLDQDGDKIMVRQRMDPVGFVRWRDSR